MKGLGYRSRLPAVLGVMLGYNQLDRIAWSLLLQDIKLDLELSDTQLGLLGGIAFSLFYAVMGIPIARWADRGFGVAIISLTAALSGVFVALCGSVQTFVQLLLVRIGVAIGDAGCTPPAQSLIAVYFRRADRARATAIFFVGSYLFGAVGATVIGWLNELYGWRLTFVSVGMLGLPLAALAWFVLKEPVRDGETVGLHGETELTDGSGCASSLSPADGTYRELFVTLWSNRTFRHLLYAWSVALFVGSGIAQWDAAFFIRSHGLGTGELGVWQSVILVLSLVGTYGGGELASRYAANNERLQMKAVAVLFASYGVIAVGAYLSPDAHLALGLKALAALGIAAITGPVYALVQTLVPSTMRAMSFALIYLIANIVGTGLGSLAIGALSDWFTPLLGNQSLRYALLISCLGYAWSGWHMWRATHSVNHDLARVLGTAIGPSPQHARVDEIDRRRTVPSIISGSNRH